MIYFLDLFGVFVFAISGALSAGRKKMDLFGVVVLASVTAIGGGTFRDLVLGITPVFWVGDPAYISVALVAAATVVLLSGKIHRRRKTLQIADAFGLALFTVIGAEIALNQQVSPIIAVIMGVMTGVAGGVIRDILAGEIPLIFQREIYALASIAGATLYVALSQLLVREDMAVIASVAVALIIRLVALRWHLSLPVLSIDAKSRKH